MPKTIAYYWDDEMMCLQCWNGFVGSKIDSEDLPDGFTCDGCGEKVNG